MTWTCFWPSCVSVCVFSSRLQRLVKDLVKQQQGRTVANGPVTKCLAWTEPWEKSPAFWRNRFVHRSQVSLVCSDVPVEQWSATGSPRAKTDLPAIISGPRPQPDYFDSGCSEINLSWQKQLLTISVCERSGVVWFGLEGGADILKVGASWFSLVPRALHHRSITSKIHANDT